MKSATNSTETEKGGEPWLELTEARPKATKKAQNVRKRGNGKLTTQTQPNRAKIDKTHKKQIKT